MNTKLSQSTKHRLTGASVLGALLVFGTVWTNLDPVPLPANEISSNNHQHTDEAGHSRASLPATNESAQTSSSLALEPFFETFPLTGQDAIATQSVEHTRAGIASSSTDAKAQQSAEQGIESAAALFDPFSDTLLIEPSGTQQDIFVLQTLGLALLETMNAAEFAAIKDDLSGISSAGWLDQLERFLHAKEAEDKTFQRWQDQIAMNPEGYKQAHLREQEALLGKPLFNQLYGDEKEFSISAEGLHGELTEQGANSKQVEDLKDSETRQFEDQWLARLNSFLDDYALIEEAALADSDKQEMKQSLIEKHFSPEEHAIIQHFLFDDSGLNSAEHHEPPAVTVR